LRIVIDTNLWISGLLWKGWAWELLCLAEAGEIELCMAPAMIEELAQVLAYEKLQPRLKQLGLSSADLLAYAMDLASVFYIPAGGPVIVAADPDDDVFLRCAIVAGAACVVSGDHHLLDLEEHAGIPILSVRAFLSQEFPREVE
jgi:putative PIN family toxin of toxin-antitoxin system